MRNTLYSLLGLAVLLVLSAAQEDPKVKGYELIPSPKNCKCFPYYLCANGSVIQDGASLIDVRIRIEGCENYLDVCCETPPLKVDPEEEYVESFEEDPLDCTGSCGVHHQQGVGFRITGEDNEAQFGEFPWMTAVLLKPDSAGEAETKNRLQYMCGGSLIHPRVVMTGAHCVKSHINSTIVVRAGEWDSQTNKEIYHHQDREVSEVVIHPYFGKSNLFHDIALLFLSVPFKPAKHIGFVCLPPQGEMPPPATTCLASGWGKDAFGKEGRYSCILKRVDLPIVEHSKCQNSLRLTRLGYFFKLHRSFICAGGEPGKDTCRGDGGSPLVCPHPKNPERFMQTGIVAWGIGCMNENPGVYVNVALFRDWIDEKMHERDLESSYYSL